MRRKRKYSGHPGYAKPRFPDFLKEYSSKRLRESRSLLASKPHITLNYQPCIYFDFASSGSVVHYSLRKGEDRFLMYQTSGKDKDTEEIPTALTIHRKNDRLVFELGLKRHFTPGVVHISDLKLAFWMKSTGGVDRISESTKEAIRNAKKVLQCNDEESENFDPDELLTIYLRLIYEHVHAQIKETFEAADLTTFKVFVAYPGAWSRETTMSFPCIAQRAGIEDCELRATELQAQLSHPKTKAFLVSLATDRDCIVYIDGGGTTTACSVVRCSEDGTCELVKELCMNHGGERSQQLLAQKCYEFHLFSHPSRNKDEDFRREFFMKLHANSSPFGSALYEDCGQSDQEFKIFEDTVKIPSTLTKEVLNSTASSVIKLIEATISKAGVYQPFTVVLGGGISRSKTLSNELLEKVLLCYSVKAIGTKTAVAEGLRHYIENEDHIDNGDNLGISVELDSISSEFHLKDDEATEYESQPNVMWLYTKKDNSSGYASHWWLVKRDTHRRLTKFHTYVFKNKWLADDERFKAVSEDIDSENTTYSKIDEALWNDRKFVFLTNLEVEEDWLSVNPSYFCVEVDILVADSRLYFNFYLIGYANDEEKVISGSEKCSRKRLTMERYNVKGEDTIEAIFSQRAEKQFAISVD